MAEGNAEGCNHVVSVVDALVIIQHSLLVVKSGYTGNIVV